MPRRAKKLNAKPELNSSQLSTRSDFTVYDYAHSAKNAAAPVAHRKIHSTASSGRLQKGATNAWRTEVKQLQGQSVLREPQLTECHDDDIADVEDDENEQVGTDADMKEVDSCKPARQVPKSQVRRRGKKKNESDCGLVYPVDLWFLVGSYVAPEDVSTFACICRGTHVVVHSARFWLGLYRRLCQHSECLPTSLQSSYVEHRPHGLRTRVIRALFHAYAPLSERILNHSSTTVSSQDPQCLIGLRCILAWHERSTKTQWKFYFKFRRGFGKSACPLSVAAIFGSEQGLLAPADVLHNRDERCVILVVTAPHFVPLPIVMGQVLAKSSVTGSVFTQSLHLFFCSEYIHSGRSDGLFAQFDPFVTTRILHWWHPHYPHRQ